MRFQKTFTRALTGGAGTLGGDGTLGTAPLVTGNNANGKPTSSADADNFVSLNAVSNQGWPGHRVGIGYLGPAAAADLNCEVWFLERSTNSFFKLEAAKALKKNQIIFFDLTSLLDNVGNLPNPSCGAVDLYVMVEKTGAPPDGTYTFGIAVDMTDLAV